MLRSFLAKSLIGGDNSNEEQRSNEQNNKFNTTVTTDEAKSIVYNLKDFQSLQAIVQDKEGLIYNKDKSNSNAVFIETSFGGINMSIKYYTVVNRHTGKFITKQNNTQNDGNLSEENNNHEENLQYKNNNNASQQENTSSQNKETSETELNDENSDVS